MSTYAEDASLLPQIMCCSRLAWRQSLRAWRLVTATVSLDSGASSLGPHQAVDSEEEGVPQDLAVLAASQALQNLHLHQRQGFDIVSWMSAVSLPFLGLRALRDDVRIAEPQIPWNRAGNGYVVPLVLGLGCGLHMHGLALNVQDHVRSLNSQGPMALATGFSCPGTLPPLGCAAAW